MSVSGVLGWLNIRGGEIAIDLPSEIYAGLDTLVTVRYANNRRYLPAFLLKVALSGGEVDFDLVDCRSEEKRSFLCRFRERGEHVINGAVVSSPYPINFFVRSRRSPAEYRFLVFPFPLRSGMPAGRDRSGKDGDLTVMAKGYEGDVAKIGDYSGCDPLRLVHWRLSAKHENLKIKELTASAQTPVMVDIAALPGRNPEEKLSRAAYLINGLMKSNRPVGLKLGERQIAPAVSRSHRLRLLSELARYGKN